MDAINNIGMPDILRALTYFLAMLLSLSIHEFSHAFVANLRGDDTAKSLGRMTINPLVHIDIMGTVIFPMMGALFLGGVIGWAKPVPVDLSNFKNRKRDHFLVAAAGPVSNVIFCFLCVLTMVVFRRYFYDPSMEESFFFPLVGLLNTMVMVNAILAVFNMIPLPPLDGAAVLAGFLPTAWGDKYDELVAPNGFWILLMLFMAGGLGWVWQASQGIVVWSAQIIGSILG